ncbi:hypothetical protein DFQ14_11646 [Halopolyspora algeriensis]|uniref:Uncharacterized protein n=1 Tax=Halopolyspora algeriensis TaxID=1500506 RepID=A0A368VKP0_9ACTN|nr:hypothetical protein [Halopolyspora algeriensis]RCW39561.1 hypothetical protein DFQ14_11646 [Halopolyspora algeriensis]
MGDDRRQDAGDPACWLDRVCTDCGRIPDEADVTVCPNCGTAIGDEDEVPRRVFPDTTDSPDAGAARDGGNRLCGRRSISRS